MFTSKIIKLNNGLDNFLRSNTNNINSDTNHNAICY